MRNSIHILTPFRIMGFLMLSVLTFSSCGKTSTSSTTTLSPEQKEVAKNSIINGLIMVPLYESYTIYGDSIVDKGISSNVKDHNFTLITGYSDNCGIPPLDFGLKAPDGEWLQFDDDADYSNIVSIAYITSLLWHGRDWVTKKLLEKVTELGINEDDTFEFRINWGRRIRIPKAMWNNPELQLKLNKAYDDIFYQLQKAVFLYFSGEKDMITDRELLNTINRFYFKYHPDEWQWVLTKEGNSSKEYKESSTGRTISFYRQDIGKEYHDWRYCTSEGEIIPDDTLVI